MILCYLQLNQYENNSFPEGSTTKIEEIRSFKVGSFHAVSTEDIPIQIICINYDNFEDEGWADEEFNSHFSRLAKKRIHNAYVIFGESFIAKGDAPRDIRKKAYESMKKSFDITKKVKYGNPKN